MYSWNDNCFLGVVCMKAGKTSIIFEVVLISAFALLSGVVGTVYWDIQQGKKERLENKEAIETGIKVGEGEIRRSSDVDEAQKEMILENKLTEKEIKNEIKEMYREIGELSRDVHHAHKRQE